MKNLILPCLIIISVIEVLAQVANPGNDLVICEFPFDGIATFDLTVNDAPILGAQDPLDFQVSYFQTEIDAQTNTNVIANAMSYVNISNPQQIFARVESLNTGLFDTTSFSIDVRIAPEDLGPFELFLCDDEVNGSTIDDEISTFNLTGLDNEVTGGNPNFSVVWFESFSDEANDIPISDPTAYQNIATPQTVIARVLDTGNDCKTLSSLTLSVLPVPTPISNVDLYACDDDNDGIADFILTDADSPITGGEPDVSVLYYETFADAVDGNPGFALASPYTNIVPFQQTLYARVTRDVPPAILPCFLVVELDLLVETLPLPPLVDLNLFMQDIDEDGVEIFDLTVNSVPLLANNVPPNDFEVTFYVSEIDAMGGNSSIDPADSFPSIGQTIWGRVENLISGCYRVTPFELVVVGVDITGIPDNIFIDEGDNDGSAIFDLTVNESIILEGLDPSIHELSYYETFSNSNNSIDPIASPETYQNIANPQIIYVRVVNTNTNSYGLTEFEIETDGVLGLASTSLDDLLIYPIPFQNTITISNYTFTNETEVNIISIQGKAIFSDVFIPKINEIELDLSFLKSGIYFIKISSEGKTIIKQLIKN